MNELQISEELQADIDEVREGLQHGEKAYCHAFERVVFSMNALQMRPFVDEVNRQLFQQATAALESAMQWQSIETAPETDIENTLSISNKEKVFHGCFFLHGLWRRYSDDGSIKTLPNPTHWMRIKPPKA